MARASSSWRWAVPLGVILWLAVSSAVARLLVYPAAGWDYSEWDAPQIAQALFLAAGCGLGVAAMVASGTRRADFYWWVLSAFICFFMLWREIELDEALLGAHAFSWKYLWGGRGNLPWANRLVLGVPSLALAAAVAWTVLRHGRLLVATARRPEVRVGLVLFVAGVVLYGIAQGCDKALGLAERHDVHVPGFRGGRDDFWEETIELAGAMCIFLGVLDTFLHRPAMPGPRAEVESSLSSFRDALRGGGETAPQAGPESPSIPAGPEYTSRSTPGAKGAPGR